jgi:hypothetical protein
MSPTKFQINRTRHGGENASFVKPRFSRFQRFFGSFVCLQYKKKSNLETKTCTLIWDTNLRSPPSFSPIGLRTAEKFQFSSVTDYRQTTHESQEAGKTIVRFDLPVATDKNGVSSISSHINVRPYQCQAISMSGHINVRPYQCQAISMSSHINVRPYQCQAISMSGHINVRSYQCQAISSKFSNIDDLWKVL